MINVLGQKDSPKDIQAAKQPGSIRLHIYWGQCASTLRTRTAAHCRRGVHAPRLQPTPHAKRVIHNTRLASVPRSHTPADPESKRPVKREAVRQMTRPARVAAKTGQRQWHKAAHSAADDCLVNGTAAEKRPTLTGLVSQAHSQSLRHIGMVGGCQSRHSDALAETGAGGRLPTPLGATGRHC